MKKYLINVSKFYYSKIIKYRTGNHRLPVETGRWDDIPLNERKCKICTTDDIGDEYHYLYTCDFFKSDLKPYFMRSQIYASIESFLPHPMKQRSLNYQNLLQLLSWKSFLCRLFFQKIEISYVPIYMKINHIFFVIKGQFPVMDYISNTIILYFKVHCIYVLCLFYCITCLRLSLMPPVSGLRCIVFNKVMFFSVLFLYYFAENNHSTFNILIHFMS